jgi:hypothetical protein
MNRLANSFCGSPVLALTAATSRIAATTPNGPFAPGGLRFALFLQTPNLPGIALTISRSCFLSCESRSLAQRTLCTPPVSAMTAPDFGFPAMRLVNSSSSSEVQCLAARFAKWLARRRSTTSSLFRHTRLAHRHLPLPLNHRA